MKTKYTILNCGQKIIGTRLLHQIPIVSFQLCLIDAITVFSNYFLLRIRPKMQLLFSSYKTFSTLVPGK